MAGTDEGLDIFREKPFATGKTHVCQLPGSTKIIDGAGRDGKKGCDLFLLKKPSGNARHFLPLLIILSKKLNLSSSFYKILSYLL